MPERYESADVDASPLGRPLEFAFSGKTASNRFLKGAMTERLSSWDPKNYEARGIPSSNLINVYKRWGEGGIGLILTGNIMIEYDQLEAAGNPIVPRGAQPTPGDKRFEAFRELGKQAKAHGSLLVAQVSHPGRQCESKIQKDPISASDVHLTADVLGMTFNKPHAASQQEIANVIEGFANAAHYLEAAGYDGIELHGAHGYLLAQFLSETTNHRTDQYGGSIENRARLIVEITQEIRKRCSKSFIVGAKLNSVEFQEKGFQPEEAKQLCQILESNGFDFIELSGGTYEKLAFTHERESTRKREAFFLEFAEKIVPGLKKTKTYITGGLKTVGAMLEAVKTVDGIGLARTITQEPDICKDILSGKIKGAIEQKFDQQNFGLTNVVAGSQIRQIGKDHAPLDGSNEKNVEAFLKDMGKLWVFVLVLICSLTRIRRVG